MTGGQDVLFCVEFWFSRFHKIDKEKREEFSSYLLRLVLHVGHDLLETILALLRVVSPAVKGDNVLPVLEDLLGGEGDIDGEAVTASSLPPGLTDPATANLVEAAGRVGDLVAREGEDEGRDVVGLEGLNKLLGKDGLGHGGTGVGGDGVDVDVVLGTLKSESPGETEDTSFLQVREK